MRSFISTPIMATAASSALLVLSSSLLVIILSTVVPVQQVLSLSFAPAALHRSLSFALPVHQNTNFRTGTSSTSRISMEADSNDVDSAKQSVTKPASKKSKKKKKPKKYVKQTAAVEAAASITTEVKLEEKKPAAPAASKKKNNNNDTANNNKNNEIIETLQKECKELVEQIEKKNLEIDTNEVTIISLRQENVDKDSKIHVINSESRNAIAEKESAIENMNKEFESKASTINTLQQQNLELNNDITKKMNTIDSNGSTIRSLTKDNDTKDSTIEKMKKVSTTDASTIDTLKQAKTIIESTISDMSTEVSGLISAIENKDSTIDEMKKESKISASTIDEMKKTKEEVEGTIVVMETKLNRLSKDIKDKDSTVQTLTKSLEESAADAATKVDKLSVDMKQKDSTIDALTKESKVDASTIESLKKTKLDIEVTITGMETESKGLKNIIAEMELQQTETKAALSELVERESKVTNNLELVQNELMNEKKKFDEATRSSDTEISTLKSELKETTQRLDVFLDEKKALQAKKEEEIMTIKRTMELQQRNLLKDRLERDFRIRATKKRENEIFGVLNEARKQPKSKDMEQELSERYSLITDVSLRAHQILLDLKMV